MSSHYGKILQTVRVRRIEKFKKMEGYIFGIVLHFDNEKGFGVVEDDEGNRYILHYKNMGRVHYKIVSQGQEVHYRPGKFKSSIVALDVALIY